MKKPLLRRLVEKFQVADGCWIWTGATNGVGYGRVCTEDRRWVYAHRAMYELIVGPIPAGLDLDHLCRTRSCVRPDHLEPVTRGENARRSPLIGRHPNSRRRT